MGDVGVAVRVQSDEGWDAVGVVDVILVFRVAVRDERRWLAIAKWCSAMARSMLSWYGLGWWC